MIDFGTGALLLCGALLAGMLDAVAGGGGLIQIPLLFAALPAQAPGTLLGTSKLAGIFGTTSAALRYARRVEIPWKIVAPAGIAALPSAYLGALSVTLMPPETLRPLIALLLVGVGVYTFTRKELGTRESDRVFQTRDALWAAGFGGALGFYDGFFGPGTGSFLLFAFVRFFGLDFLRASAAAKCVNSATNFAALAYFAGHSHVLWALGGGMAVFNIAGALIGSHLAIRRGARFVRSVFLFVVAVLVLKFVFDTARAG